MLDQYTEVDLNADGTPNHVDSNFLTLVEDPTNNKHNINIYTIDPLY